MVAPFGARLALEQVRDLAYQHRPVRRLDLCDGCSNLPIEIGLAQPALGDLGADLGLNLLGQLLL